MTAPALRPGRQDPAILHWPGRQLFAVDLWYPGQQDPIGVPPSNWPGRHQVARTEGADPRIYIAWVRSGSQRGALQPRTALHVQVRGG